MYASLEWLTVFRNLILIVAGIQAVPVVRQTKKQNEPQIEVAAHGFPAQTLRPQRIYQLRAAPDCGVPGTSKLRVIYRPLLKVTQLKSTHSAENAAL